MCAEQKEGLLNSLKPETDSDIEILWSRDEVDIVSSSYSDDSDLEILSTNLVPSRYGWQILGVQEPGSDSLCPPPPLEYQYVVLVVLKNTT
jgi:hypothetical protein